MSNIFPVFSVPLYQSKISIDNKNLYDRICRENFIDTNKNVKSKRTVNQNILLEHSYQDIYTEIKSCLHQFVHSELKLSCNLKCVCSWAVLGETGSITHNHLHTNSVFSGIYYVKSNKDNGDLMFSVPQTHNTFCNSVIELEPTEYNILNSKSWKFVPESGEIYIFPSHMYHGVTENKSSETRCCIAFNFFIDGMFSSDPTSQLHV